jgi:hypothetical protein
MRSRPGGIVCASHVQRRIYPLIPKNIICRIDETGTAHLQIDRDAWPRIVLFLDCADKGRLAVALAQFWGAPG